MIWLTSDEHFNHYNIIKYNNRPFKDLSHMHEVLISNHNSLVGKNDTVYHLGDFAFRDHEKFVTRLNGNHILITGNHDGNIRNIKGFSSIFNTYTINWKNDSIFLSHYSHRVWNKAHHGAYHAWGHSHGNLESFGRSRDVGVDANNYFPVSVENFIKSLEKESYLKHH